MTTWAIDAITALGIDSACQVEMGMQSVPARPVLYAVPAPSAVWEELGLGPAPGARPLYVGNCKSSLAMRDIGTHFGFSGEARGSSITVGSTLRLSLAALLQSSDRFCGVPRNIANLGHFSNCGFSRDHEVLLSQLVRDRLRLAFWAYDPTTGQSWN